MILQSASFQPIRNTQSANPPIDTSQGWKETHLTIHYRRYLYFLFATLGT